MDYLAFGKLDSGKAADIIKGFAKACSENEVALIGGETAEMPGVYQRDDYDISGTIVGIVEKDEIIDGSKTEKGDVVIGFESNGLHTNGYSLARKVLFEKFNLEEKPDILDLTVGEELLRVHKSYLTVISELKKHEGIKAFSHITGGGLVNNTKRVIPEGLNIEIDWDSFEILPIFKLIQETGNIEPKEMREVFNLGIGLAAVVSKDLAGNFLEKAKNIDGSAKIIGEIK
jgi:phosphoribosylformylglycinamidine cyclo-ligase